MDMVTEKNRDVVHDFFNDPLRLLSDGVWLKVLHFAQSGWLDARHRAALAVGKNSA